MAHRYRLDREGLDAVAAAWWAGEHPAGLSWSDAPSETRATVVAHVKGLLKRRRAETPGDVAALGAVETATGESARRAAARRERRAVLERWPTPFLLRLLQAARPNGVATVMDGDVYAGALDASPFPIDEIKAVLATREHVPNRADREAKRRSRANAARAQRQRPPPPRRR